MATSFAQQPHNIASNAFQYSHHRPTYSQAAAYTPPSSITPPAVSPTGNHLTSKQLSSARQLGYLPAALRPTEMAVKTKRPLTPPRSAHSSLDSQSSLATRSLPITPIDDLSSFMAPLGSISRVVTDEWNEELGEVTGAPTRGHWKPDSSVTCCANDTCSTVFSFLARRHHCRRCGGIYCTSHSARLVPLDQEARFHPQGGWVRSCDNCWGDYQIWQHDRKSRASSVASSGTTTPPAMAIDPDVQIRGSDFLGIKPKQQPHNPYCTGNESVGGADWNWSTF
ncbi:hypothetical protein K461DRAFT_272013 [Myriangium duriaei CBS 260.36]|uniref:FYVE-type domain-containing protein n=1 Tax=Myriangium duriaei CBS 260.36 TaxID=1168546 RepID=A0A9P4IXG2_9PEZI|nr:hypothetical protein K461DRAFT_272013 [Myriangium duriaei CBS 260.36]